MCGCEPGCMCTRCRYNRIGATQTYSVTSTPGTMYAPYPNVAPPVVASAPVFVYDDHHHHHGIVDEVFGHHGGHHGYGHHGHH